MFIKAASPGAADAGFAEAGSAYLALTVLYLALTVLHLDLTVLHLALTLLNLGLTVLYSDLVHQGSVPWGGRSGSRRGGPCGPQLLDLLYRVLDSFVRLDQIHHALSNLLCPNSFTMH